MSKYIMSFYCLWTEYPMNFNLIFYVVSFFNFFFAFRWRVGVKLIKVRWKCDVNFSIYLHKLWGKLENWTEKFVLYEKQSYHLLHATAHSYHRIWFNNWFKTFNLCTTPEHVLNMFYKLQLTIQNYDPFIAQNLLKSLVDCYAGFSFFHY